jgi:hypothetical protein
MEVRDDQRASEATIPKGGEHSPRPSGSPEETPIVLCIACGVGIARAVDLALTASGPTHVRCQPDRRTH